MVLENTNFFKFIIAKSLTKQGAHYGHLRFIENAIIKKKILFYILRLVHHTYFSKYTWKKEPYEQVRKETHRLKWLE